MLDAPPRARRFVRSDSDERLVALVRSGDRTAFEVLYDRHAPGLLSFCRHLLGSLDEAEDAVQQTFFSAHKALLADERDIHLKAWLYAIARNKCLSLLRSRRERVGLGEDLELVPSTAGLSAEVERREDLRAMLGDLARLPVDQRSALVLSELGAHNHDDIAEVLGVRREKVKALVFQAREALSAARVARETPCTVIREQLATARGGALRRGNLRRHLEVCAGCRAFRDEVQHQRVALSIILPVAPSFALKQAVLGGLAMSAAGAGGAAGGGAITTAGGAAAKSAAVKVMAAIAVAGGAGGAGYVAVHETRGKSVPTASAARTPLPDRQSRDQAEPVALTTPLPPAAATPPTPRVTSATHRHTGARHGHQVHPRSPSPRRPSSPPQHAALESKPAASVPPVVHRRHHGKLHREHARGPKPDDEHGNDGRRDEREDGDGDAKKPTKKAKEHPHGAPPGQLKRHHDEGDGGDGGDEGDGGAGGGDHVGLIRPRFLVPRDASV